MDNFCYSHRYLHRGHDGEGRVGALTPSRPANLVGSFGPTAPKIASFATPLAEVFVSIVPHFGKSIFFPIPKSRSCRIFSGRFRNQAFLNPSTKRPTVDSQ
jgi:hypothetical protein